MKTRLEELVQKASVAQPPDVLSRSNWTPYLPVIRILMEERAHTLTAAVEWLVGQGEIDKSRQGMACRALRQILARREAKKLRQQARIQQLGTTPWRARLRNPPAGAATGNGDHALAGTATGNGPAAAEPLPQGLETTPITTTTTA